jgi:hypothetical protein
VVALIGGRLAAGAAATGLPPTVRGTAARGRVLEAVAAVLAPTAALLVVLLVVVVLVVIVALVAVALRGAPLDPIEGALGGYLILIQAAQESAEGQRRQQGQKPAAGPGLADRTGQGIEDGRVHIGSSGQ